ncbi:MAG: metallophosphoesterase [Deltaproteobacteria bacterium]|nr:metallophosphoesterase [Deltaproteobacteria bacterium]
MSRFRGIAGPRLATGLLGLLLAAGCGGIGDDAPPVYEPVARLLVFADPHYFAPSLGIAGPAFEDRVARDRKLIAQSDAILRAMVGLVEAESPDIVLVPGDLTKDGERVSHEAAADYLRQMTAGGRRVFVVPGNHDIQNGNAESYAGDTVTPVASISAAEFADIYRNLGYDQAIARDPGSLSYVAELVPGLWLLALDSCIYGDTPGSALTGGRLADGTKAWTRLWLDEARRRGCRVLAMMHHGLFEHFGSQTLLFPEYVIDERDVVATLLGDGGARVVFTGHFHANDITQGQPGASASPIFDVETGATVTFPCPYRIVGLASDVMTIATKHITAIDYDLGGAADFPTLARDSLRVGLEGQIADLIRQPPYGLSPDQATALAPWLGDGLLAHYAGDEVMPADVLREVQGLLASTNAIEILAGAMLESIWTDLPPADNDVTLDLAPR